MLARLAPLQSVCEHHRIGGGRSSELKPRDCGGGRESVDERARRIVRLCVDLYSVWSVTDDISSGRRYGAMRRGLCGRMQWRRRLLNTDK